MTRGHRCAALYWSVLDPWVGIDAAVNRTMVKAGQINNKNTIKQI
jgi:hypothetical protein